MNLNFENRTYRRRWGRKLLIWLLLLIPFAGASAYVGLSYAKYRSELSNKTSDVTIAKWAFDTDNSSATITAAFDQTYNSDTLVSGKIAPGTSGHFELALVNTHTEVGVAYSVTITNSNKPTNLLFYSDAQHQNALNGAITGTLAPLTGTATITVYWEWVFDLAAPNEGSHDTADTSDGATAETMTVTFAIVGEQVQPHA